MGEIPFPLAPSWVETDLNNLALHAPNSDFDDLLRGSSPNQPQRVVIKRISEAISEAGPQPPPVEPCVFDLRNFGPKVVVHNVINVI